MLTKTLWKGKMAEIVVLLAPGFEEVEAITAIDFLIIRPACGDPRAVRISRKARKEREA